MKTSYNVTVGFLFDNPLKNNLEDLGVKYKILGGLQGLAKYIQTEKVEIIHFYGSKRIQQIVTKSAPHYVNIYESVFDSGTKGNSPLVGDKTGIDAICFETKELQKKVRTHIPSFVINHG